MKSNHVDYFEPHTLKLLDEAFRASLAMACCRGCSSDLRQQLAQRIMACASLGETNHDALVEFALRELELNRRVPHPAACRPLNDRETAIAGFPNDFDTLVSQSSSNPTAGARLGPVVRL
jgi:LmbE family N-acetylglucosaminyl deacetylase